MYVPALVGTLRTPSGERICGGVVQIETATGWREVELGPANYFHGGAEGDNHIWARAPGFASSGVRNVHVDGDGCHPRTQRVDIVLRKVAGNSELGACPKPDFPFDLPRSPVYEQRPIIDSVRIEGGIEHAGRRAAELRPVLLECWDALHQDADAKSHLTLRVEVGEGGHVSSVKPEPSDDENGALTDCVVHAVQGLKLAPPRAGRGALTVSLWFGLKVSPH